MSIHGQGPILPPEGEPNLERKQNTFEPDIDTFLLPISGKAPERDKEALAAQINSLIDESLEPEKEPAAFNAASLAAPLSSSKKGNLIANALAREAQNILHDHN